ncbi:MAG TPA: nitroreductase/quinone reductase family protein [Candidatus Limnocylindrales bacterium]|nr:nitroreductase/quinone reductase family protein [Candidatus Limnocylindrales bacterium]
MMLLTADVQAELRRPQLIDITTHGRKTGQPRRIELVFHNVGGRILISGRPGFPRDWIANLKADSRMTFHLKGPLRADIPAHGRVIQDRIEREELLRPIAATWRTNHALMVRSAPLVEVIFD